MSSWGECHPEGLGARNWLTITRTGVARQELVVKFMCLFTLSTWVACILTHTLICIPTHKSWQVKPYAGGMLT